MAALRNGHPAVCVVRSSRKWLVTGMAGSAVADRTSMETPARSWSAGSEHIPRRASRMSSAGQPENNDLTRRQGFEVQVRHPAGGARLWQLLRAARRDRLRLPGGRRHVLAVLAAIQNELQADAELAAAFSAFTSVTFGAAMPKAEQLPARSTLAGWRRCCRAALNRRIMLVVAVMAALATVLALGLTLALTASSPGGRTRCDPAFAFAPACHGPSGAPAGVGGPLQRSSPPPAYSRR